MNNTAVGRDGVSGPSIEVDWARTVQLIQVKMRAGTYMFTSYRQIAISKGAHSLPRIVSVPTARDRIVLKSLAALLLDLFPAARTPPAQVRIQSLKAAIASGRWDSFIRIDVRNFYPSISHRSIRKAMKPKIRKPEILALLMRAISTPTVTFRERRPNYSTLVGVPQGLSISNILAEISMLEMDSDFSGRVDLFYCRYVDDILILCNHLDQTRLLDEVDSACKRVGLTIHPLGEGSKTQVGETSNDFEYLGYRFTPQCLSVRKSSVQKLESTIVQLFTAYKYHMATKSDPDWKERSARALRRRLDLVISGCVYENVPRGWLHYFSQLDDITLLGRLDAFVVGMRKRFGLPDDWAAKTFTRAYWHITKPSPSSPSYVPNFDRFSDDAKRNFLSELFPRTSFDALNNQELSVRFHAELKRLIAKLDRDISQVS
ncbi:hypothetical protein B7R54_07215 [Subtercola boreus]|uniref:Reverse transcriptase domain-containing protein n=1 Tax=Subtercola boreus TaxID=120213 RepID=A0A3E0VJK2_9MICO|nr:reverse transcriptase domain-containing protein [Subtercola boreus]RFA09037.1 hypothetical protein B7R54_07215 [Subtercola boreus]